MPGSLLAAVLRLVSLELVDFPGAIAMVTAHPAQACALNDGVALEIGRRANFLQVRRASLADGTHHGVARAVWREGRRVV